MTTEEKIKDINNYVQDFLNRFGLTSFGTINIRCSFKLTNYNNNYSNYFQVDSEDEAKEILKEFITVPFNHDIFKSSIFDSSKPIYLSVDLELPR